MLMAQCKCKLTKEQQKHYESVRWLVNDGPRASGRTFLLAFAFVEKAIELGYPIRIWDHEQQGHSGEHLRYLMNQIDAIVSHFPELILKFNRSRQTIEITYECPEEISFIKHKFPTP